MGHLWGSNTSGVFCSLIYCAHWRGRRGGAFSRELGAFSSTFRKRRMERVVCDFSPAAHRLCNPSRFPSFVATIFIFSFSILRRISFSLTHTRPAASSSCWERTNEWRKWMPSQRLFPWLRFGTRWMYCWPGPKGRISCRVWQRQQRGSNACVSQLLKHKAETRTAST